jgi:sulfite reductase (NADPH) hemoprotein beta-component
MQEYASLMKGLSGEPILILYGSDGGNAQSVAKKLAGEAKQRGLAPRYAVSVVYARGVLWYMYMCHW